MKTRTKVIIAIGSNRNQEENLSKAYEHLRYMFKNSLFGPRMWTEPIGLENSDKFLNQVMLGETICSKKSVLAALRSVEQRCGRRIRGPTGRWMFRWISTFCSMAMRNCTRTNGSVVTSRVLSATSKRRMLRGIGNI